MSKMEARIQLVLKKKKYKWQVRTLDLSHCKTEGEIDSLTFLEGLPGLETIDMHDANINTLKWFPRLNALTELDLSGNQLTGGLEVLKDCQNIHVLKLNNNKLKEMTSIEPLKNLLFLTSLEIDGNEFKDHGKQFRNNVFKELPSLQVLGGYYKDDRENDDDNSDERENESNHSWLKDETYLGESNDSDAENNKIYSNDDKAHNETEDDGSRFCLNETNSDDDEMSFGSAYYNDRRISLRHSVRRFFPVLGRKIRKSFSNLRSCHKRKRNIDSDYEIPVINLKFIKSNQVSTSGISLFDTLLVDVEGTEADAHYIELPIEVWIHVLKYLSTEDLLNIIRVSSHLYEMVHTHMNSAISNVTIKTMKLKTNGYLPILTMRRFEHKTALDLKEHHDSIYNGKVHFDWLSGETWIDDHKLDLPLANFVSKYHLSQFSLLKLIELMKYLKKGEHNIKTINFEANKLSPIPMVLLSEAVDLQHTMLTASQIHQIFSYLQLNKFTKLKELGLRGIDLSLIPNRLLNGLLKLKRVDLSKTQMTKRQVDYILNSIIDSDDLVITDLSLAECYGYKCGPNSEDSGDEQDEEDREDRTDSDDDEFLLCRSTLVESESLFGVAVSKLEIVDLSWIPLRTLQVEKLVERNIQFTKLTCINLSYINLKNFDISKLATFISSLKVVNVSCTSVSDDHIWAFLRESLIKNTLEGISLDGHFANFNEDLFVKAFSRLKRFVLTKGGCKDEPIENKVWQTLIESKTLEDINVIALTCCWKNLRDFPGLEERFPTALRDFSCLNDRWHFINL